MSTSLPLSSQAEVHSLDASDSNNNHHPFEEQNIQLPCLSNAFKTEESFQVDSSASGRYQYNDENFDDFEVTNPAINVFSSEI